MLYLRTTLRYRVSIFCCFKLQLHDILKANIIHYIYLITLLSSYFADSLLLTTVLVLFTTLSNCNLILVEVRCKYVFINPKILSGRIEDQCFK